MRYVIDTNVVVSGVLKANSKPGRVLDLLLGGEIEAVASEELLAEYREVLGRPKFGFGDGLAAMLVDGIKMQCEVTVARPQKRCLSPDSKDQMVVDLAVAADAAIVTGNLRHFEGYELTLSPSAFLDQLATKQERL